MKERCYCGDPDCRRCFPRFECEEEREYDPNSIMGMAEDIKKKADVLDRLLRPDEGPWMKPKKAIDETEDV